VPHVELFCDEELNQTTLPLLRAKLEEAMTLRPGHLVVNLSACRYLNAQAVLVLLEAHRAIWQAGGRLVLRGCGTENMRLLVLAGVQQVFEFEDGAHDPGRPLPRGGLA
jgi:anti-anti-sigma factor